MLTKTKMLGLIMACALAFSLPVKSYADMGGADKDWHQSGGEHHDRGQMLAKILNLSDDQVKQLKDSRDKQKTAKKSIIEQIKTNKVALESEIIKATPDMNKVNDAQTQIKALLSQMVDSHLNFMMEVKRIMTPEQFAGYMALEKQEDMMKEQHQFGHKDGFGKEGDEHKHWADKGDGDQD